MRKNDDLPVCALVDQPRGDSAFTIVILRGDRVIRGLGGGVHSLFRAELALRRFLAPFRGRPLRRILESPGGSRAAQPMTERSPFLSAGWGRYQTRGLSFANYDGSSLPSSRWEPELGSDRPHLGNAR